MDSQIAVSCRGVCKRYGKKEKSVLDRLNMTVRKGAIYGLLGASGCGKTTLLSAILGIKTIQKGQINKGNLSEKDIGYMPQEISLAMELSVKGAVQHFGWIYGMTNKEIDQRYEFLHQLLDLPPRNRLIKNLSGGQQRRVSLAVALVNDPTLLILDEPTVGLDPVLRQQIWDYLMQRAQDGKTIIITTHYIEEARQAHSIGLMRSGKLLAEGSPHGLMEQYQCSSLEEVFLQLSQMQLEGKSTEESPMDHIEIKNKKERLILKIINGTIFFTNSGHAKAMITKNFYKFFRHFGTMLFAIAFPILQFVLLYLCIGDDFGGLNIGVVNKELRGYKSCEDFNRSNEIGAFFDPVTNDCRYAALGCKLLLGLPKSVADVIYFDSVEEAKEVIYKEDLLSIIEIPQNFTELLTKLRRRDDVTELELDQLQILVHEDRSGFPLVTYFRRNFLERYLNFSKEIETDCGHNGRWADIPIFMNDPIYGQKHPTYFMSMLPGFLTVGSVFLAVSISALSLVTEKVAGDWERCQAAGVSKGEIIIFHFITLSILNSVQNIVIHVMSFFIYRVESRGNLGVIFLLLTSHGLVGVGFGIFLSAISKTITDCIYMSLGILYPFLILSGMCWPLEGMHPWLASFSYYFLPSTITVQAMTNVIHKGYLLSSISVSKGVYSSFIWVAMFAIVNTIILKLEKK